MVQPRNGYSQYYFALESTFFEAKLTRPRPGRGQMLEAETNLSRPRPRPKFWPQGQSGLEALTSLQRDAQPFQICRDCLLRQQKETSSDTTTATARKLMSNLWRC